MEAWEEAAGEVVALAAAMAPVMGLEVAPEDQLAGDTEAWEDPTAAGTAVANNN